MAFDSFEVCTRVTGMSADFWLGLRQDWGLWHALRTKESAEQRWRQRTGIEPAGALERRTPIGFEDRGRHQPCFRCRRQVTTGGALMQVELRRFLCGCRDCSLASRSHSKLGGICRLLMNLATGSRASQLEKGCRTCYGMDVPMGADHSRAAKPR